MSALELLQEVHDAVMHPPPVTTPRHLALQLLAVVGACVIFRIMHSTVLAPIVHDAKYFALHTAVNFVIVCFSIGDLWRQIMNPSRGIFCDPITPGGPPHCSNQMPNVLTLALHTFHMWMWTMRSIDLIHHIPAFIAGTFNALFPTGPVQNFTFLFIMGIPGGYDYALLVGMKHGYLNRMAEKRANSRLNLWLRSPGLIISSFSIFQALTQHSDEFRTPIHFVVSVFVLLHNTWNAQYFMSLALESEIRYKEKLEDGGHDKKE
eukprot:m.340398 g.340398  ORF g.340398 m.340398 type:complete len:263 (+) comp19272_c0_seq1:326-1114(+)